ncbi:endo-1,6-alpha-mannosidase [Lyophyllum atratum]|nr:endo-1,6-alpha-mannosidase [Lyophyllum atratum]
MRLSLCCFVLNLSAFAAAQDLSVSTSWRKYSNSRPRTERIQISQNAINAIMPQLDIATGEFKGIGYWQSGNAWSAIANHDHVSGQKTYQANVVKNLKTVFRLRKNFDQFGWWAQAAVYGYRAYRDPALLSYAVSTWKHVSQFAITAAQARDRKQPNKNFQIASQCEGQTMVGGVFWRPTSDDKSINSITTGLSASLAEITGDKKYTNAAIASANWIQVHNLKSGSIVLDSVNGQDCSRSPATWLFTYNSGKFIEGLSILADVTHDSRWRNLMIKILAASVKSTSWQGEDGIITEGSSTSRNNDGVRFKAVLIRGLYEAFARNSQNNDLRILVHSYIDVQYNALLDLAKRGDAYSARWHGPPQAFTTWGQLAALDVLVSAIGAN